MQLYWSHPLMELLLWPQSLLKPNLFLDILCSTGTVTKALHKEEQEGQSSDTFNS